MFKLFISTIFISTLAQAASFPLDKIIVKLKANRTLPQFSEVIKTQNLFENTYVLTTNDLATLEAKLINSNLFEYVEKSQKFKQDLLPVVTSKIVSEQAVSSSIFNDPKLSSVWSFKDSAQNGVSVEAAYLQYRTQSTQPVIVAVVDTGVDFNHEDLKDIMWKNENEIPANGIDDDNNGYVDDVNGINTLIRDRNGNATGEIKDTHSHGTHVSGTIAAKQNNGKGIAGIASNVSIMGIRTVPNNGDERDVDVAEAFIYAAKNGAKIINCSFGKAKNEGQKLIPDTLDYIAKNYGVLVVAAAGNDSQNLDKYPSYPAGFSNENLLVVASTASNGGMSGFSNYGKIGVDVAAPGSDIYSTLPNNKYGSMSGTSMAAPTTVGVLAEILSHHPEFTYKELKNVIMTSVTKISKFDPKLVTGGRIDLLSALDYSRSFSESNK